METKKEIKKMVKVRINIPTLKPNFNESQLSTQSIQATLQMQNNVLPTGTEIEVTEETAKLWCNEVFYVSDGLMGVRDPIKEKLNITVENPYQIIQSNEFTYNQKIAALNEYGKQMDKATKIAIVRATLI